MELTGVEPVSALSINTPLIHRLSPANPWGRNRHLSRTVGCSSERLANRLTRERLLAHPLGFVHSP